MDIIAKKRDGKILKTDEINFLIDGYAKGEIPDYQMSAWAMAVYLQGMTAKETADLTMAMAHSGDLVNLSLIQGIKVDKHSTGGVGDTTTLVLAPWVAAAGVSVAKMSGRGLGHTGGTIDKLEAIEGFSVERTETEFIEQVNRIGVAIMSQSGNLTPADKQLYALRDVTATVSSIPLISSSIMSKKIASGANAIVLDVKTGKGAFMKSIEDSIQLAQAMVEIGEQVGRETIAIVSDMDQPLGYAVGNALEVKEAIDTLKGNGPKDLEELCLVLGSYMLLLAHKVNTYEEGREKLIELMENGEALNKLKQFVHAQGGNRVMMDYPGLLPAADNIVSIRSKKSGYISSIEAEEIGIAAMMLGAGRETKTSTIDPSVGVVLKKKVGDLIQQGDALVDLHTNEIEATKLQAISEKVEKAYSISTEQPTKSQLIYAVVTKNGIETM